MPVDLKFGKKHKIKEDRFIESLFQFRSKVESQKKSILITLCAVAGAALITFLVFQVRARTNEEARTLFGEAMMEYQAGRFTSSIAAFKRVADNYGSSKSAPKALYLIGGLYYELGNYALAVEAYKRYIEKYDESHFLNAAVYKGLGCSYMQTGDYGNAISAFRTALSKYPEDFSVPELRYKLARCLIEKKDGASARGELESILRQHPASPYAREADLLLSAL